MRKYVKCPFCERWLQVTKHNRLPNHKAGYDKALKCPCSQRIVEKNWDTWEFSWLTK